MCSRRGHCLIIFPIAIWRETGSCLTPVWGRRREEVGWLVRVSSLCWNYSFRADPRSASAGYPLPVSQKWIYVDSRNKAARGQCTEASSQMYSLIMKNTASKRTIRTCQRQILSVENLHEKPILTRETSDKQESVCVRVCRCGWSGMFQVILMAPVIKHLFLSGSKQKSRHHPRHFNRENWIEGMG